MSAGWAADGVIGVRAGNTTRHRGRDSGSGTMQVNKEVAGERGKGGTTDGQCNMERSCAEQERAPTGGSRLIGNTSSTSGLARFPRICSGSNKAQACGKIIATSARIKSSGGISSLLLHLGAAMLNGAPGTFSTQDGRDQTLPQTTITVQISSSLGRNLRRTSWAQMRHSGWPVYLLLVMASGHIERLHNDSCLSTSCFSHGPHHDAVSTARVCMPLHITAYRL